MALDIKIQLDLLLDIKSKQKSPDKPVELGELTLEQAENLHYLRRQGYIEYLGFLDENNQTIFRIVGLTTSGEKLIMELHDKIEHQIRLHSVESHQRSMEIYQRQMNRILVLTLLIALTGLGWQIYDRIFVPKTNNPSPAVQSVPIDSELPDSP